MSEFFQSALGFVRENWTSGLEILILSAILYYIYLYLRGTHGARILIGLALVFLSLTFISQLLDLAVLAAARGEPVTRPNPLLLAQPKHRPRP